MDSAMVTARMPKEKKDAAARVLDSLGTNASSAINELFDYVIEHKALPYEDQMQTHTWSQSDFAEALSILESISLPANNQFSKLTDDDITQLRLQRQ